MNTYYLYKSTSVNRHMSKTLSLALSCDKYSLFNPKGEFKRELNLKKPNPTEISFNLETIQDIRCDGLSDLKFRFSQNRLSVTHTCRFYPVSSSGYTSICSVRYSNPKVRPHVKRYFLVLGVLDHLIDHQPVNARSVCLIGPG